MLRAKKYMVAFDCIVILGQCKNKLYDGTSVGRSSNDSSIGNIAIVSFFGLAHSSTKMAIQSIDTIKTVEGTRINLSSLSYAALPTTPYRAIAMFVRFFWFR